MTRSKGEFLCGKNAVPLKRIVKRQLVLSPLSRPERWMYISVWVGSVMYLCFSVLKTSLEREEDLENYYMTQGWKWIGRNKVCGLNVPVSGNSPGFIRDASKDQADFEWHFWSTYLFDGWPWLLGHIPLALVCRKVAFLFKKIKYIYTCYAAVVLCVILGPRVFTMLVVHTLIIYLSALTNSVLLTWIVSIFLVSTLNFDLFLTYMNRWLLDSEAEDNSQYLLMMFTTAMCNLRYTSFAVEMCWHRQKRKKDTTVHSITENTAVQTSDVDKEDSCSKPSEDFPTQGSPRTVAHSKGSSSVESSPKSKYKADSTSPKSRYKRNRQGVDNDPLGGATKYEFPSPLEYHSRSGVRRLEYGVMDMWFYCFYLPLFCTGPLLTYDSFRIQWQKAPSNWTVQRVYSVTRCVVRLVWWMTCCQLVLHYMYFSSLMSDERLLSQMSLWSLAGVGFCQGQFFMVKYVLLFGIPACIALFDELETPDPPCCISVVYLYSQMWKYIYIPLGGSHRGQLTRFLASFCCFTFIYIWHGAEKDLFVWTMINFLGICLESSGSYITKSQIYQTLEETYLGLAWSQRIKAFSAVPLFSSSILAIFTFFKGTSIGYIYFQRLVLNGWPVSILTVTFVLYCCIQTSIEIDRWKKNRSVNSKQD